MNRLEPVSFDASVPGRRGCVLPPLDVAEKAVASLLPGEMLRREPVCLPELSEVDVVRHFTRLSQKNFAVDEGFYPLGSCTMKYNPKCNEDARAFPASRWRIPCRGGVFSGGAAAHVRTHGDADGDHRHGRRFSSACGGRPRRADGNHDHPGLPSASGDEKRTKILIPDTAHGTNPASAALAGYDVVEVASDRRGNVDLDALREAMDDRVAGIMLTNPNTLGLFEETITDVADIVHGKGGLLYYDGANFNAILARSARGYGLRCDPSEPAQVLQHSPPAAVDPVPGPSAWERHCFPFCLFLSSASAATSMNSTRTVLCPSGRFAPSTAISVFWCAPTPIS